jgi:hypothetical protein
MPGTSRLRPAYPNARTVSTKNPYPATISASRVPKPRDRADNGRAPPRWPYEQRKNTTSPR